MSARCEMEEERAKKDKKVGQKDTDREGRADRLIAHHWSRESVSECGVWIPSSFESRSVSLTSRVRTELRRSSNSNKLRATHGPSPPTAADPDVATAASPHYGRPPPLW